MPAPNIETDNSVMGRESHTPVMPNRSENKNDIGTRSKNPLNNDIICAGTALSFEVKSTDRIILNPIKGMEVKYNFSPLIAMFCKYILFSRLNAKVIESEHKNILR